MNHNQQTLKEQLESICPEEHHDFIVIFSGKESKKVDGLYHPEKMEIIIHNRNFTEWNRLVYTGIHELAHHIEFKTRKSTETNRKPHNPDYKNIQRSLLLKAIETGVYEDPFMPGSSNINKAFVEIVSLDSRIAHNRKELGKWLLHYMDYCQKHDIEFEDFSNRILGKSKKEISTLIGFYGDDINPEFGEAAMKIMKEEKDPEKRLDIEKMLADGLPSSMVAIRPMETPEADKDAEISEIQKELMKIEKQISRDLKRKENLESMLNALNGGV